MSDMAKLLKERPEPTIHVELNFGGGLRPEATALYGGHRFTARAKSSAAAARMVVEKVQKAVRRAGSPRPTKAVIGGIEVNL